MILLIAGAWALDCSGEACDATLQVVDQVNTTTGRTTLSDLGPTRLHPSSVLATFETLLQVGSDAACDGSGSVIVGTIGGAFPFRGPWSGLWADLDGEASGAASGTFDRRTRTFSGTYTGDGAGQFGDGWARFNAARRITGSRDGGFVVGTWVRTAGRNGVFTTLYGDCTTDDEAVFETWFGTGEAGGPSTFTADIQPVFSSSCTESACHDSIAPAADLDLTPGAYARIVLQPASQLPSMNLIEPGDPDNSYLWYKLRGLQGTVGGSGLSMPRNQPLLPSATRSVIETWIIEDALP